MARPANPQNVFPAILTEAGEQWLLAEDEAVKAKMQGIVVTDARNASRNVRAWFGFPDMEITEQTYPFMTIDMVDIREATERSHSGLALYVTDREGQPLPAGVGRLGDLPTPYDLDYQVTAYSRNPRHDRQIVRQFYKYKAQSRFGELLVEADGTRRRLELLGMATRDTVDENNKRVFVKSFTIRVSSELGSGFSYAPAKFAETASIKVESGFTPVNLTATP